MRPILMVVVFSITFALDAHAGTQDGAVIALHGQLMSKNPCSSTDPNSLGIPCSEYAVDNLPTHTATNVYLVVARADAPVGISCLGVGIDYDVPASVSWTLCADLDFPTNGGGGCDRTWPERVTGNRMCYSSSINCQRRIIGEDGVHAVFGSFYVYAYGNGTFATVPHPCLLSGPEIAVADCDAVQTDLPRSSLGAVGFGSAVGCNPCLDGCGPVPVGKVSWSGIKSQYSTDR